MNTKPKQNNYKKYIFVLEITILSLEKYFIRYVLYYV